MSNQRKGNTGNVTESNLFGIRACLALYRSRPEDIVKVYFVKERRRDLKDLLDWCVKNRKGFDVVTDEDLSKLSKSEHHEGVVVRAKIKETHTLQNLLNKFDSQDQVTLIGLYGVGNPHNLGAILRTAAFFGCEGVVLDKEDGAKLSGAAFRVSQGGAEEVEVAVVREMREALEFLKGAGFEIVATTPHTNTDLYSTNFGKRVVLLFGAEDEGLPKNLLSLANKQVSIPASGGIESLNVAASVAVLVSERVRGLSGRVQPRGRDERRAR